MEKIDQEFIEFMQKAMEISGGNNEIASLFAYVYIQPEDISIEMIAKETGYSLATVSNRVKILESVGLVIKFRKPKSKRVYVKARRDLLGLDEEEFVNKKLSVINYTKKSVPQIIKKYSSKPTKDQKLKIQILKGYLAQVEQTEKLLEKIREGFKCLRLSQ